MMKSTVMQRCKSLCTGWRRATMSTGVCVCVYVCVCVCMSMLVDEAVGYTV